jgi:anti-sigma B factor antagonist
MKTSSKGLAGNVDGNSRKGCFMNLSSSQMEPAHVVTVDSNRIDAAVAIQFKDLLRAKMAPIEGRHILDLSNVEFVDSSGLGAIVAAMKMMEDNQTLELAGLNPGVAKVFSLTRMDTVFVIHSTVEEGVSARVG